MELVLTVAFGKCTSERESEVKVRGGVTSQMSGYVSSFISTNLPGSICVKL